jgi:hypothetical protein
MPPARWRERIYTDETRLRGLEILIFLVHEGGLCLCSREFHSPGFINIIKKEKSSWQNIKRLNIALVKTVK